LSLKSILSLKNVSADFGDFYIKNINLEIKEKEYFVILGPTGAGKTLLLEIIAGFHKLKEGQIFIMGKNISKIPPNERKIGFVYQDYSLFPHMNVENNISFGLEMQKLKRAEIRRRTSSMMDRLKINHLKNRYPITLSGGEQQKIALARALIINPEFLLLDEPFGALDPVSKKQAMKVVKEIHSNNNLTTIEVTHNQDEAILGDRISLIMNGEIVDTGPPKQIFNAPKNISNANFLGVENIISGEITKNIEGYAEVKTKNFMINCLSKFNSGKVTLFIRPENIVLSQSPFKSSLRNNIHSKVKELFLISKELIQISLENGLKVYITNNAKEDLDIKVGDDVIASFKATSISLKR